MKKLTAMILALLMTLSLAACSSAGSPGSDNPGSPTQSGGGSQNGKQDDIVLWTLSNDLKQLADRYEEQTGNHVEVVVFDSADFETKIMQTLGAKSKDLDVFVGEPQMLPNFYEAGFCADLSALDGEVKTRLVDYTYEAGCDEDGVLRAISYQACPGSVIYRRDLAKEVFGTDDPDEIAKHFSSFEEIEKTADTLQAKGYCVFGDEGNKGQFGVCSGPCSFFGGGTFLTVNEFSQHKEAAQKFIEFCTLNDETSQWWLEASNGDVVNNKAVLEHNKDYQNESFGNQNTYAFYLAEMEKIDFNLTGYDDACKDAWSKAITAVKKGEQTKEQAVQEFYQNVITQFPELSVPADSPYYNG